MGPRECSDFEECYEDAVGSISLIAGIQNVVLRRGTAPGTESLTRIKGLNQP